MVSHWLATLRSESESGESDSDINVHHSESRARAGRWALGLGRPGRLENFKLCNLALGSLALRLIDLNVMNEPSTLTFFLRARGDGPRPGPPGPGDCAAARPPAARAGAARPGP
jgi:hypothetical protein